MTPFGSLHWRPIRDAPLNYRQNVFTGDSRWHLVTGAFGGLGRLAVNWLREKGARRIVLLAPRVDESWLRDVEGGQTRAAVVMWAMPGNWPRS